MNSTWQPCSRCGFDSSRGGKNFVTGLIRFFALAIVLAVVVSSIQQRSAPVTFNRSSGIYPYAWISLIIGNTAQVYLHISEFRVRIPFFGFGPLKMSISGEYRPVRIPAYAKCPFSSPLGFGYPTVAVLAHPGYSCSSRLS